MKKGTFGVDPSINHYKKNFILIFFVIMFFLFPSQIRAQIRWDGGGGDNLWSTAANWNTNIVPVSTDEVLLDNLNGVPTSYSVILPAGAVTTTIAKLTIAPTGPNTITLILPNTNTAVPGLLVGDGTPATDDIIINAGGVLINSSTAVTGNGVQVDLANGTLRINNGGKYIHNTTATTGGTAALLSTVAGTELGVYEYDTPVPFGINASGMTYGSLSLAKNLGPFGIYTAAGGAVLNVRGNFTVDAGVTFSSSMTAAFNLAGNFINNGTVTFPSAQLLNFNGTVQQSFTNTGTVVLGAAQDVTLNNTLGLKLNNDITINGILTFTAGKITTGGNTLNITKTTAGAIVGADATKYIITDGLTGGLKRTITALPNAYDFPVGTATNYKPANINFTTAPSAGSLTARFRDYYPGWFNVPNSFTDGPLTINKVSFQGTWFVDAADGLAGGIYTGTFTGYGVGDILDYTKTVLVKRPSIGGNWAVDGIHVATAGSNVQPVLSRTGMFGFSEFAIGGELGIALPVSFNYLNGIRQNGNHLLNWKVTCNNDAQATMTLERSSGKQNFNSINSITASALRCQQPFEYIDRKPLTGLNYYRLKIEDPNGKISYSPIVAVLNKSTGFEIVNLAPSVVNNNAVLNVTAAQKTKMDIVITDITGRQVQKISYNLVAGSNQFNLNVAGLAAGSYQITGYTAADDPKTIRFVKQ